MLLFTFPYGLDLYQPPTTCLCEGRWHHDTQPLTYLRLQKVIQKKREEKKMLTSHEIKKKVNEKEVPEDEKEKNAMRNENLILKRGKKNKNG